LGAAGAFVGVEFPDDDGSEGRQPSFWTAMIALNRSPATGASLAGSGLGDSAVCTLVNASDNVLIDGVAAEQFTVAVDAAADDMTEGTVIPAATNAASGSAKAHFRNMNRW
jgi:hypothetical protein